MIKLDDETLVEWLQSYPNVKKSLVRILVRRYKNLIYKEIAKQCDQRYDKEEIVQEIIFLFVQLLNEYDKKRGIPLAGFLKVKLPNRIYNYFKSQVKKWDIEISRDGLLANNAEDVNEFYEINNTSVELYDFWIGLSQILTETGFSVLFWKYEYEYGTDEISVLMNLRGPCDVEKMLNLVLENLRYDDRAFDGITYDPAEKVHGTLKPFKKERVDMTYHLFQILHQEVAEFCGVFPHGIKTLKQIKSIKTLYNRGQAIFNRPLDELVSFIVHECGCQTEEKNGARAIC